MLSARITVLMASSSADTAATKLLSILDALRDKIFGFMGAAIGNFIAPLMALGIFIYMIFQVVMLIMDKNKGEDISDRWRAIILSFIILLVVLSIGFMAGDWINFFK